MKFAKREKYFVSTAACLILAFILLQFLIIPFFEKRERVHKGINAREKELKEIAVLSTEYQDFKNSSQRIMGILAKRKKGFTLFSFLDKAAGKARIKDRIKYMKPSTSKAQGPFKESMVELKLEGITIEQLVSYLYLIEEPEDLIFIKRISITDNQKDAGSLDSILQILTFQ
ncbi:hypothetical protein ACFLZG_01065 [Thermodesulfobacteriota bacterium]